MPTTISISLASISGEAGPFTLFLRKTSDRSLVNAGGDALTEVEVDTVKTGVWTATVAETIPSEDCLARIYEGSSEAAAAILIDSILYSGQTEIGKEAATGGAGDAEQATLLAVENKVDAISEALAGSSPVEPTGATVFGLLAQIAISSGTGARTVTITVNDGSTVLQNARVRLTEGANTFIGLTNASGVVTFNVDDATYAVAITKSGYSYAGATLVVDGDEAVTYSMTQITPSAPDDPALCAVTIPIVNQFGAALPGEVVEIRFNEFATGADTTALVLSPPPTLTSDDEGLVEVNLLRDGKYSVFYGQDGYKRRLDFTVPDAGSFTVGE